jgi:hypothetical protein
MKVGDDEQALFFPEQSTGEICCERYARNHDDSRRGPR